MKKKKEYVKGVHASHSWSPLKVGQKEQLQLSCGAGAAATTAYS